MSVPAVGIRIEGADQALKALRVMEPQTAKEVGKAVSEVSKTLAGAMRARMPGGPPLSNWNTGGLPSWSTPSVRSSRRGMSARATAVGGAAAVFALAGRNDGKNAQGAHLIAVMKARFSDLVMSGSNGGPNRASKPVAAEQYPAALEAVRAAAFRAVDEVNRRMP